MKSRIDMNNFKFNQCVLTYYDENGNKSTIDIPDTTESSTTTPQPPSGTPIVNEQSRFTDLLPYIFIGIGVFFLIVLVTCIYCCCSRRKERKRRKEIDAQYKIVASTLTNITDSEDGCTYETLSMMDPTYHGDVQLPTRKQKHKRLEGVSNGLAALKRFLSEDGESVTSTDTTISTVYDYKRNQPLPAIPETRNKDNIKAIDEYTEIGSDSIKSQSVYHHLGAKGRSENMIMDNNPYDSLRQSTLINSDFQETAPKTDDYFVLEQTSKQGADPDSINKNEQSDGYFLLEKVKHLNTESSENNINCRQSDENNVNNVHSSEKNVSSVHSSKNDDNGIQNSEKLDTRDELTKSVEHKQDNCVAKDIKDNIVHGSTSKNGNESNKQENATGDRLSNAYYTISPENSVMPVQGGLNEYLEPNKNFNRTSYMEPSDIKRNSYIDILPEMKRIEKMPNGTRGTIPAYAVVRK